MQQVDGLEATKVTTLPGLWTVHAEYRIADNRLVIGPEVARRYAPLTRRELPSAIYGLPLDNKPKLLDFTRRYGHLGYFDLLPLADELDVILTEPLPWVWAHVRTVRLVMEGLRILQKRDEPQASKYLNAISTPYSGLGLGVGDALERSILHGVSLQEDIDSTGLVGARVGIGGQVHALIWTARTRGTALDTVGELVTFLLSRNLEGVTRTVHFDAKSHSIESQYRFKALIQVVYWQLLDAAQGGEFGECLECKAPFVRTDGRQQFCPPRYKERESLCGGRYRQREWRKANPKPKKGGRKDGQA